MRHSKSSTCFSFSTSTYSWDLSCAPLAMPQGISSVGAHPNTQRHAPRWFEILTTHWGKGVTSSPNRLLVVLTTLLDLLVASWRDPVRFLKSLIFSSNFYTVFFHSRLFSSSGKSFHFTKYSRRTVIPCLT